jgi:osmotically inducible lipoprotein OsmB
MAPSNHASFRKKLMTLTIAGAAMITIAGCYGQPMSTREKGTLAGGAIGAGGGALVGVAVGHPLAGAAIGGVVGAGTGMAIGNSMQNSENRQRYGE